MSLDSIFEIDHSLDILKGGGSWIDLFGHEGLSDLLVELVCVGEILVNLF